MSKQTPAMDRKREWRMAYLRAHPDANLAAVGREWDVSRQYVQKLSRRVKATSVSEFLVILRKGGEA